MSSPQDRIVAFWQGLPALAKEDVDIEDSCPICFTAFEALFADCGITKLGCGHVFCKNDLAEWIRNLHGSCPTCRYDFLDIHPPGSDDESSDGGEYIPEEEDDEDSFMLTSSDGFTEAEFEAEDMDEDRDDLWERSDFDEIHGSEPSSEDSMNGEDEAEAVHVDVSVVINDDQDSPLDDSSDDSTEEPK